LWVGEDDDHAEVIDREIEAPGRRGGGRAPQRLPVVDRQASISPATKA